MIDHAAALDRLLSFHRDVRAALMSARRQHGLHAVCRSSAADTIYAIDAAVDPMMESFFEEWGRTTPLIVVAEGLHDADGNEGPVAFPRGLRQEDAEIRVIVDPIDGTRGLMYDKRSAWALAAVAPNRGPGTRLRDIEVAAMTELPTSKMGWGDVLWSIKGQASQGRREDLRSGAAEPLPLGPSQARDLRHGFATISNFFPGTKELASRLMEYLVGEAIGPADVTQAMVFDDQYISTGGQFYELIVGHDRFNADLRSIFYAMQRQPEGLCVHPYDVTAMMIAQNAGVLLTDGRGQPLDGPLDTTTGLSWAGYANAALRRQIEPLLNAFLSNPTNSRLT